MKTSDLRNCAGVGRDKLEARLKECADLLDILLIRTDSRTVDVEACMAAIEHFERFE